MDITKLMDCYKSLYLEQLDIASSFITMLFFCKSDKSIVIDYNGSLVRNPNYIKIPASFYTIIYILAIENTKQITHLLEKSTSNKYYHITTDNLNSSYLKNINKNKITNTYGAPVGTYSSFNPYGLWFSCGNSWINFVTNIQQKENNVINKWSLSTYVYEVFISKSVYLINNMNEYKAFIKRYKNNDKNITIYNTINWKKVYKENDGLIICPLLADTILGNNSNNFIPSVTKEQTLNSFYKKILGPKYKSNLIYLSQWMRHWSASSGVIWAAAGLKDIKLIKKLDTFAPLEKYLVQ